MKTKYRSLMAVLMTLAACAAGAARAADTHAILETGDNCAKPEYPRESLRNHEQGTVMLSALVGADGTVLELKTEKGSGSRALDKAARQALLGCKLTPATRNGQAVQEWTRVEYAWKVE